MLTASYFPPSLWFENLIHFFRLLLRYFNFEWNVSSFEFHPFPWGSYKGITVPTQAGSLPPSNCPLLPAAPFSLPHPSGFLASGHICATTMPAAGKTLLSTHCTDSTIETVPPSPWKTYRKMESFRFYWESRKNRAKLSSISAPNIPPPALALQSQMLPLTWDVSPPSGSRNPTHPCFH